MRSWMKAITLTVVTLGGLSANAVAQAPGHDYPPFVAVNGYQRSDFLDHRFDKAVFLSDDKGTKTTVAGHLIYNAYELKDPTYGGDPYLINSLQEQVKSIPGAQVLNEDDSRKINGVGVPATPYAFLTIRFQKDNIPVWVAMVRAGDEYGITVVEEQAFHP